jgi:hypothetical protein
MRGLKTRKKAGMNGRKRTGNRIGARVIRTTAAFVILMRMPWKLSQTRSRLGAFDIAVLRFELERFLSTVFPARALGLQRRDG